MHNTTTLKLKRKLNSVINNFLTFLTIVFFLLWHVRMSSVKKVNRNTFTQQKGFFTCHFFQVEKKWARYLTLAASHTWQIQVMSLNTRAKWECTVWKPSVISSVLCSVMHCSLLPFHKLPASTCRLWDKLTVVETLLSNPNLCCAELSVIMQGVTRSERGCQISTLFCKN